MKKIKYLILKLAVLGLRILYIPMKWLPVQKKITFMSRQSDKPSIDFRLLGKAIKREHPDYKVVMITKQLKNPLLYAISVLIQMYHIATSKAVILDSYCISSKTDDTTKMMFYPLITNLSNKPMVIEKIRLKVVGENEEITLTPVIEDPYMHDGYNISPNNSISQWVCFEIKNDVEKKLKIIKYILIIEDAYKNADTRTVIWLKEMVNTDEKKN